MKKTLLLACGLLLSIAGFAQNPEVQATINDVKFFGIDFSQVRTYDAKESLDKFKEAFGRINELFIAEPKKYDVAKNFKKNVTETLVDQVKELNNTITDDILHGGSKDFQLSDEQVAQQIKSLPITEAEGTGLIFVAELLNKKKDRGTYHIVFFDIASRDILDTWRATGDAGGAGLRNFWARSVFEVMDHVKIKKNK
jgi:hypothetical protein